MFRPCTTATAEPGTVCAQPRALIPALTDRAAGSENARSVPPETSAAYHKSGILRVLQPRRFGGLQADFGVFSQIVDDWHVLGLRSTGRSPSPPIRSAAVWNA